MRQEKTQSHESEQSVAERFAGIYEGAQIELIAYTELPSEAVKHFESQSEKFIPHDEYIPKNFSTIGKITHPDGTLTYFAEQTKTYNKEKGETELLTYFMDYIDGEPAGYAELRYNVTPELGGFVDPFVGMTRTYGPEDEKFGFGNFQKRGLGTRRLIEMDAYAKALHGKSLDSDTVLIHDSVDDHGVLQSSIERIWERLVEEGKAEKYVRHTAKDGSKTFAYRMK